MRLKRHYLWILVVTSLLALLGGLFYVKQLGEPEEKGLVLLTISLDREVMPAETSSYEIQRASEHFSHVLLGWTLTPDFQADVSQRMGEGYSISVQSQEKQNLLFTVSAPQGDYDEAKLFVLTDLLKERLAMHNESTHLAYVIAYESYSYLGAYRSDFRIVLGVFVLAFVLMSFLLFVWDYAYCSRSKASH